MRWIPILIIGFLVFVSIFAFLIYTKLSLDQKDHLAKTTSILGVIVGVLATSFSVLWAAHTYKESTKLTADLAKEGAELQKELAASGLYREHMRISLEKGNQEFLGTSKLARQEPPMKDSSLEAQNEYERYQWYVGHALLSFESIFDVAPDDEAWKDTFRGFVCDHKVYLSSCEFQSERHPTLAELLTKTLKTECHEQPKAR